jgi:hypothetical protein
LNVKLTRESVRDMSIQWALKCEVESTKDMDIIIVVGCEAEQSIGDGH